MKQKHCRRARRDLALETYQSVDQDMVSFKEHWLAFNVEHQKELKEDAAERAKSAQRARKAR